MITAKSFIEKLNSIHIAYYRNLNKNSNAENISVVAELLESASTLAFFSRSKSRNHYELSDEEDKVLGEIFADAGELASKLRNFLDGKGDKQP